MMLDLWNLTKHSLHCNLYEQQNWLRPYTNTHCVPIDISLLSSYRSRAKHNKNLPKHSQLGVGPFWYWSDELTSCFVTNPPSFLFLVSFSECNEYHVHCIRFLVHGPDYHQYWIHSKVTKYMPQTCLISLTQACTCCDSHLEVAKTSESTSRP